MLATHLIRLVELHADDLVRAVITDLRSNPRTPTFGRVSEAELQGRLRDLYHHFGDWIGDPSDTRIEAQYSDVGRRRCRDRIPLAEVVYGLVIIKTHVRRFVQERGLIQSLLELYSQEQLSQMASNFFDRAVYFTVKGYEDERRRLEAETSRTRSRGVA